MPKNPWSGVLNTTQEGEVCPQFDLLSFNYLGVEDCLFLNVHTPQLPIGEEERLLPVMFYIHGGGFVTGSGSSDWFSPDFIVAKDTILVTINYRLGALGFLSLNTSAAPGNVGLRDQNLALKWVQKNIRAFNGDPGNVTIFGISAGSASVDYHLLSPMSKGLFHKAILHSGTSLSPWARTRNPEKLVDRLVKSLEITTEDPDQLLKDLQNEDAEKLVTYAFNTLDEEDIKNGESYAFVPIVEKVLPGVEAFLNEEPMNLLISGQYNHAPTITGFVDNEGGLFKTTSYAAYIDNLKRREFIDFLPSSFDVDRVEFDVRLRETYNQTDDIDAVDAFLSDVCFLGGIAQSLRNRLRHNFTDNYIYMFGYDGTINFIKALLQIEAKGAYHSDDSTYVSDSIYLSHITPTVQDTLVRSRMVRMWTDFAKTG